MSHYMDQDQNIINSRPSSPNSSHFSSNLKIKKYIFIGLSQKQATLVRLLKDEFPDFSCHSHWIFMKNSDELSIHIDRHSLVVSGEAIDNGVINALYRLGHLQYLPFPLFLKYFHSLFTLHENTYDKTKAVGLAFLGDPSSKLCENLLTLYGYKVFTAFSVEDLESLMEKGLHYLVFDLDMNMLPEKTRMAALQKIVFFQKQGMTTSVLKNFDKGSLFNDILSPVKEISNILLSPEEYVIFLRKYLYFKDREQFLQNFPEDNAYLQRPAVPEENVNLAKLSLHGFSDLKDAKKTYNRVLSLKANQNQEGAELQKNSLNLRFLLSDYVIAHLSENLDTAQRELFTFFPK